MADPTFIDPEAEIVYVPRDEVLAYAEREARPASTPRARRTPTATASARSRSSSRTTRSRTLRWRSWPESSTAPTSPRTSMRRRNRPACSRSPTASPCLELDDQRQLELELPVYDALYAWSSATPRPGLTRHLQLRPGPDPGTDVDAEGCHPGEVADPPAAQATLGSFRRPQLRVRTCDPAPAASRAGATGASPSPLQAHVRMSPFRPNPALELFDGHRGADDRHPAERGSPLPG